MDGLLLWLSLRAAKAQIRLKKIAFSALFGAGFALVYPLLYLPDFWGFLLKIAVGFFLCLAAYPRLKTKKEWGRYALSCIFFFAFSFCFGGVLYALFLPGEERVKAVFVLSLAVPFALLICFLIKKLWRKRREENFLYDCEIAYKQRSVRVLSLYDSGNSSIKNGLPVCFLSPDLAYELWGEEYFQKEKEVGQVRDEITIFTLGGVKTLPLYKGELSIFDEKRRIVKREAYFAPSSNMISREYKMILSSRILQDVEGNRGENNESF